MKKHIYFYYSLKVFTGLMSLATVVFFVKYAGQYVYGQYALITSVVFTINSSVGGWINQVILKFFDNKKKQESLNKFIYVSILISALIGLAIVHSYFKKYSEIQVCFIIVFFLGGFLYSIYSSFLQKKFQFKLITLMEVVRTVILFSIPVIALFFYKIKLNDTSLLIGIALAYSISLLVSLLVGVRFRLMGVKKVNAFMRIRVKKDLLKEYLSYGIPIGLWLAIAAMLNISDRYLIEYYFTYTEVGIYSSIYDVTYKICIFAFSPILTAIHPLIMNAYNEKKNDFHEIILKGLKLELKILPLLIILIMVLSFFSNKMLNVDGYRFFLIAMPVLFGVFFWNFSMILHKILEVQNKIMLMLFFVLIALLTNVIGNILLMPIYGFEVAAYTTAFGFFMYALLIFIANKFQEKRKSLLF